MAFKYKLVKEASPTDIEKAAGTVGPDVMRDVATKHLNGKDFDDLEQTLGQAGLEQSEIDKILNMWAERRMFINPNEKHYLSEKWSEYIMNSKRNRIISDTNQKSDTLTSRQDSGTDLLGIIDVKSDWADICVDDLDSAITCDGLLIDICSTR